MNKRKEFPPDLLSIFDKPGRVWTEDEIGSVLEWLNHPAQLRYLLQYTTFHLRLSARRRENVEDAWQDYCCSLMEKYIQRYDPTRGLHFWEYLLKWLSYFCMDWGKEIGKRYGRESQMPAVEGDDGSMIEVEAVLADNTDLEMRFYYDELRAILQRVLAKCASVDVRVLELHLQGFRHKEIAAQLGVSEVSARVKLHRILSLIRENLTWVNGR
jgi:RNA polymerase sigma factor (sigma-70 family)